MCPSALRAHQIHRLIRWLALKVSICLWMKYLVTSELGEHNHMKNTVRRTIAFLGVTLLAIPLIGAPATAAAPFRGSSSSFDQAMPVTPAQKEVQRLLRNIASNTAVASTHADKLDAFTRVGSRLSYSTHAAELTAAK